MAASDDIDHLLREAANLPVRLREAVDDSVRLLDATGAMLYLLEPETQQLRWAYESGFRASGDLGWVRAIRFPVGVGLFGRAVAENRPQRTDDYRADARFVHAPMLDRFATELDIASVATAPVVGVNGPLGAIGAFSNERGRFDEQSLVLLEVLAAHAALAIDNGQLIEQLERSRTELAGRVTAERTLREIAARLTAIRDRRSIARHVAADARRLLQGDVAFLALVSDGELHDSTITGDIDPGLVATLESARFPVAGGLLERAIGEGSAVSVEDALASPDSGGSAPRDLVESLGVRGVAMTPLRAEGEVIGVLATWSRKARRFTQNEVDLLQALADLAATAIENARLGEELAASEERHRFLVERAPDLIWTVDEHERITFINDRIESLLGFDARSLIGRPVFDLVHEDSIDEIRRLWTRGTTDRTVERTYRFHLRHRDGWPVPVELRSVGIVVDGTLRGFQGSLRDETRREQLERDLRESEQRYRVLIEHSPDLIAAVDTQGRISYVSGRSADFVGAEPAELIGRPAWELVDPGTRQVMLDAWRRRDHEPEVEQEYRVNLVHRDGHLVPVEIRSLGVVVDGVFVGSQSSIRDMSERDRMERDLRRQEAELAASQERAKLAQELHDSVTQALFSMTLTTRSAEMLLQRDPPRAVEKLAELRQLATDALAEMRALIFELRPGSLDQDGLVVALRKHAAAVQGRTGLPVTVETTCDDEERLPPGIEESLYRIGQEALHNVVKHARASQARILVARDDEGVRLSVTDDGAGFDPGTVPSGHLGLEGMRTRAERVGGRFSVASAPGQGARIEVLVPAAVAPARFPAQ